ncbi:fructosamine kinase family protein [Pseudooceanicola sp. C21-150M6]|uniref:fructosamine kinase family protein n=1 Tax=Pseudooceanicola sp. C21-150M6 TaxID=3434355 RepID=UPI003D7F96BD
MQRQPLHGGDLSTIDRLDLADGRVVALKTGPNVEIEARMLRTLAQAGIPVPEVLAVQGKGLVLEFLPDSHASDQHWSLAGQTLRRLHDVRGSAYGWEEDYWLGKVLVAGGFYAGWVDYWYETRLAAKLSALPRDIAARIEALQPKLPGLIPDTPPASLLHGDLWQGNLIFGPERTVHFIDPACAYGHGEVDLAMLHLFGRAGQAFDEGYGPLEPGWQDRRPVYQLWPALVHLRLFGASYRAMVERLLDSLGV